MIRCYSCGNELNNGNYCPICNAEVKEYKKILVKSYYLYNKALEAAKLRDISRAIPLLKTSLKAYKANTEARNLLGLCYYEIGDVMTALKEWVISKSFQQSEDNKAAEYILKVQSNRQRLDSMNSLIRKYNLALRDCTQGKMDVAIIQLKKVTGSNVIKILSAYQLLGMIYIKSEEYRKAYDILRQAKKIDRYNNITLAYLVELELLFNDTKKKKKKQVKEKLPPNSNEETVKNTANSQNSEYFSYVSYKEPSPIVAFSSLLFGIILGGLLVWFLIVPAKEQNISKKYNTEINTMSEKIAVLQNTITNLEDQVEVYKQAADDIKTESKSKLNKAKMSKDLLEAFSKMKSENYQETRKILEKIKTDKISENERLLYYEIAKVACEQDIKAAYKEGYSQLKNKNYNNAIDKFKEVLKWQPDHDEALYYLAQSYINKDEKKSALDVLQEYLQILPTGKHSRAVSREILKIQTELNSEE